MPESQVSFSNNITIFTHIYIYSAVAHALGLYIYIFIYLFIIESYTKHKQNII